MLRRSGPHLAQTRCQRHRIFFLASGWGVKIDFTLFMYAQNAHNFMGNSNMHADQENYFTPDLCPPPPPKVWLLGLDAQWVNHLEERLLDQAQARAPYTPLFWGRSRSIPQCMVSNV